MNDVHLEILNTKKLYREIFNNILDSMPELFERLKPTCQNCEKISCCDINKNSPFQVFEENCKLKSWQENIVHALEVDLSKEILQKLKEIENDKALFTCNRCTICCKFATSEFDYNTLKEKAKKGDNFAKQFISIFQPYKDFNEAKKAYPDYVEMLEENLEDINKVYFYYCKKLNNDGLCSDYKNRLQICRDFPNNPLVLLPKCCGYKEWKEKHHFEALLAHATLEIIEFYIKKLKNVSV